jgi:hypothetical protein
VDVGEARQDHLARAVDPLGGGIARQDVGAGADGGDAIRLDGDRGVVVDRVAIVDGGDRGIVYNDGLGIPLVAFADHRMRGRRRQGNAFPTASAAPVNKYGVILA